MQPLVLSSTFIFLSLKNELKIFLPTETYEKGGPALKWLLLEQHATIYHPIRHLSSSFNSKK